MPARATLKTRKPTCAPSWPLILLAGEAKVGKTYAAAEFSGDDRIARTFWIDLGEGCADEYGAVPGADYEIIDHDGTWIDILAQVEAVRDIAEKSLANGEGPVMLVIDSMTAEWQMLSAWADARARRSKANQAALAKDPDAEIDITANYWNDATARHGKLMHILKNFPGIAVMTALETEKTQFGPNGKPIQGAPKMARPDGQKRLAADASVWIRLSHDSAPTVVGIRRPVGTNITPGKDQPQPWPDFTLAKLVFEHLGLGPENARPRNTPALTADQPDRSADAPRDDQAAERHRAEVARLAGELIRWVLNVLDVDAAAVRHTKMLTHQAAQSNAIPFLDEDVKERLGIAPDVERFTMVELAERHVEYVGKHKRSVLHPLDDQPAGEAFPVTGGETAAADQ